MPVGFKNGTSGQVDIAVNAILSAAASHTFLGLTEYGTPAVVITKGNPYTHIILRGGHEPNYSSIHINDALELLRKENLHETIMVDCSHGNSQKDYKKQAIVFEDVLKQRVDGNNGIIGVMIESNLFEGSQKIPNDLTNFDKSTLQYGVSRTDGCLGWDDTRSLIMEAYKTLQ
jgi:3-deoxy-7-phosphoheptulonate synthase